MIIEYKFDLTVWQGGNDLFILSETDILTFQQGR